MSNPLAMNRYSDLTREQLIALIEQMVKQNELLLLRDQQREERIAQLEAR